MTRAPLAFVLIGLTAGCPSDSNDTLDLGEDVTVSDDANRLTLTGVDWNLTWRGDAVESGWSTTNDLGITFTVSEGWLLDYSATLVRCNESVATRAPVAPRGRRTFSPWSLLGGTAHAGHEVYDDPSAVEPQWGEALEMLAPVHLGTRSFAPDVYCGVHWLVARADQGVQSEGGTDLSGTSLRLAAHWATDGDEGELVIDSDFTQGVVLEFPDEALKAPTEATVAHLSLVRDEQGLFDGVDPRAMNEYAIAWAVLENVAAHVRLEVTLNEPAPSKE
ncbi:MAG: hypothetical protein KDA24_27910 [Deltaproteobacteria bacterium]|nr:hypothetical protein [Deltaproteobacteria bacterium]